MKQLMDALIASILLAQLPLESPSISKRKSAQVFKPVGKFISWKTKGRRARDELKKG